MPRDPQELAFGPSSHRPGCALQHTISENVDRYLGRNPSSFIRHRVVCPFELIAGKTTPRPHEEDSATRTPLSQLPKTSAPTGSIQARG